MVSKSALALVHEPCSLSQAAPMIPTSHSQSPPIFRLLSVLMPVHNDLNKLRAAITPILGSAVSVPLEVVCVDAGSLDGSADLLDELAATDDRIRVIRQPTNRGPGSALREAIRHMRGDIAIIQDASVVYDPTDYSMLARPHPRREGRRRIRFSVCFGNPPPCAWLLVCRP